MWSNPFVVLLFPHPDPNFHLLPSARRRAVHCWANSFRSNQRLHFTVCVTKRLWNVLEVLARHSCSAYFPATLLAFCVKIAPNRKLKARGIRYISKYNTMRWLFIWIFLKSRHCLSQQIISQSFNWLLSVAIITNTNRAKHETQSILKIWSFFALHVQRRGKNPRRDTDVNSNHGSKPLE